MKKKVYFAVAHRAVEEYIEKEMANEIEVIGSAVYRESVIPAIKKEEPDILIIRETLPGKMDFLEIIDAVRVQCQKHVQIIVMTGGRQPGDELLSALVRYSVFDLVIGDNINIKEVCKLIRKPNVWKDVCMYAPKVKIDERTKKQVFEPPVVPKVIEKEVIREIIVDHTDVADAKTSIKTAKELEKIKQEKIEIENEQLKIKEEKEKINREKESLAQEKKRIEKEYEERQIEFEASMESRLNAIYEEKDRLIEIEKKRIQDELDFAMNEVERIKSEAEIMIDEEKRRLHQSKQAEMEKNIEILRLENEQKIKKLEQEAVKKIQLEQQRYNQMKIDEIENFKKENAQLEEKYRRLKEQELSERLKREKESQEMKDEIAKLKEKQNLLEKQRKEDLMALEEAKMKLESEKKVKYNAQNEAREELKALEEALKEKEEELNQEKELLEVKYTSLESSLFAEFEKRKRDIENDAKKQLDTSRTALKEEMQKVLEMEKKKLLSNTTIPRSELERAFVSKQSQISESYKIKLQSLMDSIKEQTAKKMSELEKDLILYKKSEEEKLSKEKAELDKEKESLNKEMAAFYEDKKNLIDSIEKERKKLEIKHEEFERNIKAKMIEKEKLLDSERISLKEKEDELNKKIRLFNEEQQRAIDNKEEILKIQKTEKEKQLEIERQNLLEEQKNFEKQRLELEEKSRKEDEYIKNQLKKLEEEKAVLQKMKSEVKNLNMQNSNISAKYVLTFLGCKAGVGTTTVAFNTAVALASKGHKVLYLELNKEFSSISYTYKLGFYDVGIDFAMNQIQENDYDSALKNIVLLKDVERNISTEDIMYANYKKMPKTLDYLFYSGQYYSGERTYDEKSFRDLMMCLFVRLDYDYIIFDMNMEVEHKGQANSLILDETLRDVLRFSSKVYFVITQDISSIGACLSARKIMKKLSIPVNDFRFVLNKYDAKASLSKRVLSEWLKVDVNLVLPDKHREVLDSNYEGLPFVLYSKDKEVSKFYKTMVSDIVGKKEKNKM